MLKSKRLTLTFILFCLCLPLFAQPTYQGDTVLVQTGRMPLTLAQTGRNITVVGQQELQNMVFTSIDDLLNYLPGIEVQNRNGFGVQGDITLRGATFAQVMVLIDGAKINDPLTAHFNSNIPITPTEIERIEILRGAAAAVYGADAVGGVIHIITKSATDKVDEATEANGLFQLGDHKLAHLQQGFTYQKGNSFLSGGLQSSQAGGERIAEKLLADSTLLEAYNNYFTVRTAGLAFGYRFSPTWRMKIRTSYDYRNFSARYFYTGSVFDKSVETTQHAWNQLLVQHTGEQSSTTFNVTYRHNKDEFTFSPDFPSTNEHISQFTNLNISHLRPINAELTLQAGIQADFRSIESNDRGNHEDGHVGAWLMAAYQLSSNVFLTGSTRLDYDQNYGLEFTPQLNLSWLLSDRIVVRGSAGRSIRAADYTERYVSYNLDNLTPGRSRGNPDLLAESSWSEEVGADINLGRHWQVRSTLFARQSTNLIDYVPTLSDEIKDNSRLTLGETYYYAKNIADVSTQGVEVESWWQYRSAQASWQWSVGYTYLDSSNDEGTPSVYLSSHARHLLNTNFQSQFRKFRIAINGMYKMRTARLASAINSELSEDYTVWNVRVGYQVNEHIGINFQVQNLFDVAYADILGAPLPRRWLLGGLRFDL